MELIRIILGYKPRIKAKKRQKPEDKAKDKKYRLANKAKLKQYQKTYSKKNKVALKKRDKMPHHKIH
jgi:hypothetical protein